MAYPAGRPAVDRTGRRYGRLLVLEFAGTMLRSDPKPVYAWRCRCDCGRGCRIAGKHLADGGVISCGCLGVERRAEVNDARARPVIGPRDERYPSVSAAARAHGITPRSVQWHLIKGTGRFRDAA